MSTKLEKALFAYTTARDGGAGRKQAREEAYQAVPGFRELIKEDMSISGQWGNAIQAYERARRLAGDNPTVPNTNGTNNHKRPPSDNGYRPTQDIEKYLMAIDPAIGDEIPLNLEYLRYKYGKNHDAAFRYPFTDENSRLIVAGWRFEVLNNKTREYRVKVVGKPSPLPPEPEPAPAPPAERTYTAAEVQALFAEFMAKRP